MTEQNSEENDILTHIITYKNQAISFEPFELKQENLRKVRTSISGDCPEGVWAWIRDEDIPIYENEKTGTIVVVLANSPLSLPFDGWKSYIPVELRGNQRPECDFTKIKGSAIFHHTKESWANEQD